MTFMRVSMLELMLFNVIYVFLPLKDIFSLMSFTHLSVTISYILMSFRHFPSHDLCILMSFMQLSFT